VIDFASSRKGPEAPEAVTIHDGLLQQVRMGQFSSTTTRVVLDVEKVRRYQLFAMYSPYRLIIDVHGEKAQEPPKKDSLSTTAVRVQPQPPSPPPPAPKTQLVVMLDPGHGGKDPGAIGVGNVSEKDVVLAISKRLEQKLSSRLSVKVLFTRSTDVFIPLEERIAQANAAKADLFVSIHANASPNTNLQGVETYYLNNTNDRATIRLASLENGIRPGGNRRVNDLVYLLSDLIQSGKEEESIALAHNLQEAVVARAKEEYAAVQDLGVKKGPFYVLVGAQMPCVLVETAFISHRVEGKHLAAPRYQEALAEGLYLGIARFLRTEPSRKSL
jgi:N-acetylmuramoyl-L-alanine amidase